MHRHSRREVPSLMENKSPCLTYSPLDILHLMLGRVTRPTPRRREESTTGLTMPSASPARVTWLSLVTTVTTNGTIAPMAQERDTGNGHVGSRIPVSSCSSLGERKRPGARAALPTSLQAEGDFVLGERQWRFLIILAPRPSLRLFCSQREERR
jgi:hypothetical protein